MGIQIAPSLQHPPSAAPTSAWQLIVGSPLVSVKSEAAGAAAALTGLLGQQPKRPPGRGTGARGWRGTPAGRASGGGTGGGEWRPARGPFRSALAILPATQRTLLVLATQRGGGGGARGQRAIARELLLLQALRQVPRGPHADQSWATAERGCREVGLAAVTEGLHAAAAAHAVSMQHLASYHMLAGNESLYRPA